VVADIRIALGRVGVEVRADSQGLGGGGLLSPEDIGAVGRALAFSSNPQHECGQLAVGPQGSRPCAGGTKWLDDLAGT
jgi:hypothetical protein